MLGANVFQVQKYDNVVVWIDHRRREIRKDLKREYSDEIRERCSAVKFVGAEVWNYGISFRYKDKKTNPSFLLAGVNRNISIIILSRSDRAVAIMRSDVLSNTRVVVLGQDIVDELFPYENPLGNYIKISGIKFKVVGTFERMGTSTFGESKDNKAVIPLTTFEDIYGKYRSVNITVQAVSMERIEEAKSQVIGVLRQLRKRAPGDENDFAIWSNDNLIETFQNTAQMIQFGAILIGMISLLVGSIGVMNIMLVSVTERTREIGVRKAVGAKRKEILLQFLNESIFLTLIGGTLGIILGFALAFIVTMTFDMPYATPIWAIVASVLVTGAVGLFAGIYPAAKASRLDPIEALRYE